MDRYSQIGEQGEPLNGSVASRAAAVEPDAERVRRYDEYPAVARRSMWRAFGRFMFFLSATLGVAMKLHSWWAALPGALAFWHLWQWILQCVGRARPAVAYRQGLLVPAIVASVEPLRIVAMAEMQREEGQPTIWGLKRITCRELPGHLLKTGERVPCAALFGMPLHFGSFVWGLMEPHPLCWATGDRNVLARAEEAIDEAEWETLVKLAPLASQKEDADKKVQYYDAELAEYDPYTKKSQE
jgi:hypothetical protein